MSEENINNSSEKLESEENINLDNTVPVEENETKLNSESNDGSDKENISSEKENSEQKELTEDERRAEEESEKIHDLETAEPMDAYKVLIIDDDRWMQRIFSQYLKTWGMTHLAASNSFKGLEMAIEEQPLMIFLDIVMPDVTGDITIKFLKNIEATANIPVVIISGNLNKEVLKNTYKDGAEGFITKPFTKDVLQEKLTTCIDKKIMRRIVKDGLIAPSAATKKYLAV